MKKHLFRKIWLHTYPDIATSHNKMVQESRKDLSYDPRTVMSDVREPDHGDKKGAYQPGEIGINSNIFQSSLDRFGEIPLGCLPNITFIPEGAIVVEISHLQLAFLN